MKTSWKHGERHVDAKIGGIYILGRKKIYILEDFYGVDALILEVFFLLQEAMSEDCLRSKKILYTRMMMQQFSAR